MRIDLAHFLSCPQMNGQVHNVLLQNMGQPAAPFVYGSETEPCFYTDGQSPGFGGLDNVRCNVGTADQPASLPILGYIRYRTSHINIDAFKPFFRHADTHLTKEFRLISPDMGYHRLFILRKSQTSAHTVVPIRVTIALGIRKLRKKHIRSGCFTYDMAKHNIRHIFHGRQYKERPW
ncbi:Uncharacterised protein [Actinobacillus pleuropneumoniae]|nr:Uncharacterised protein [Actinobacillus pleuropneumoniae]